MAPPTPPNRNQNRDQLKNTIEVELKLLSDTALDNFQKVTKNLESSVNSLSQIVGTLRDAVQGATMQLTGGTGAGGEYRTPSGIIVPGASPAAGIFGVKSTAYRRDEAQEQQTTQAANTAAASANTRIQQALQTADQALRRGLNVDPNSEAQGLFGHARLYGSGMLGYAAEGAALGAGYKAAGAATGFLRHPIRSTLGTDLTGFGQNIGQSREGILGTPLFSPAQQSGFWARINALNQSWFGLNPNYSTQQAMEAQSLANQYGYSGSRNDQFVGMLGRLTQSTGIQQSTLAQLTDQGFRYGGESMRSFMAAMQNLPQVARDAQMGVNQFAESLLQATNAVAQSSGMAATPNVARNQIMSLSQATGFSPTVSANMLNNPLYQNLAASQTGGNLYQALFGPNRSSIMLGQQQKIISQIAGVSSWSELQRVMKTDQPRFSQIMNKLTWLWRTNPEILGGMDPSQVVAELSRGDSQGTAQAANDLAQAANLNGAPVGSNFTISHLMHEIGFSAATRHNFIQKYGQESYSQQVQKLQADLARRTQPTQKQRQQVMVTLSPQARQLLTFMKPLSPDQRVNSGGTISHYAVEAATALGTEYPWQWG